MNARTAPVVSFSFRVYSEFRISIYSELITPNSELLAVRREWILNRGI
jgi:hypothetical protein